MPHKDPDERRAYFRAYYAKRRSDPDFMASRRAAVNRSHVKHAERYSHEQREARYGLDQVGFYELWESQGGRCVICAKPLTARYNVDHNHTTGKVRGLLCSACNRGIGLLGDDPDRVRTALGYLEAGECL